MSDAPERIWLALRVGATDWHLPVKGETMSWGNSKHAYYVRADMAPDAAYVGAAQKCLELLDGLVAESGRGVEYGEEDAFRRGEWFEAQDIAAIEQLRAALAAKPQAAPVRVVTDMKLEKYRAERMRKAAALMNRHHRETCEANGDHPYEVDTLYSIAIEALEAERQRILSALAGQP